MNKNYERDRLGKKIPTSTQIRKELLDTLKSKSAATGVPVTRLVEDALVLYLYFAFCPGSVEIDELVADGHLSTASNMAHDFLCGEFLFPNEGRRRG